MSAVATISVPEILSELTELVGAGDIPAARKLGNTLVNKADLHDLKVIARVVAELEQRPRTAVDVLRTWWKSAPCEADRALIEACAPKGDQLRYRTQSGTDQAHRRNRISTYRAPSAVRTSQQSEDARRKRNTRQQRTDAAALARYQAERAGVAEGTQRQDRDDAAQAEKVYASGFDYDRAALYGTEESRCLSCSISRGRYDLDRVRVRAGHGDDGLCGECRESGDEGIPELAPGHTLADAIHARCDFIVKQLGTVAARVLLRTEWKQAKAARKSAVLAALADYAAANFPPLTPHRLTAGLDSCTSCAEDRTARDVRGLTADDGVCAECRAFDADEAAPIAA